MPRKVIQTNDYQGTDRRRNGRIRINFGDIFKVVSLFISILIAGTIAWTTLKGEVKAWADKTKENSNCLKETKEKDAKQDEALTVVTTKMENIEENVSQMRIDMQKNQADNIQAQSDNQKLLYKILGKLDEEDE